VELGIDFWDTASAPRGLSDRSQVLTGQPDLAAGTTPARCA
jgi:hypothetical protein